MDSMEKIVEPSIFLDKMKTYIGDNNNQIAKQIENLNIVASQLESNIDMSLRKIENLEEIKENLESELSINKSKMSKMELQSQVSTHVFVELEKIQKENTEIQETIDKIEQEKGEQLLTISTLQEQIRQKEDLWGQTKSNYVDELKEIYTSLNQCIINTKNKINDSVLSLKASDEKLMSKLSFGIVDETPYESLELSMNSKLTNDDDNDDFDISEVLFNEDNEVIDDEEIDLTSNSSDEESSESSESDEESCTSGNASLSQTDQFDINAVEIYDTDSDGSDDSELSE